MMKFLTGWRMYAALVAAAGVIFASGLGTGFVTGSRYEKGKQSEQYRRQIEDLLAEDAKDDRRRVLENAELQREIEAYDRDLAVSNANIRLALDAVATCPAFPAEWVRQWNALADPPDYAGSSVRVSE